MFETTTIYTNSKFHFTKFIFINRNLPNKMRGFKEREWLGQKKVWLYEKLPPLEGGMSLTKSDIGTNLLRNLNQ